MFKQTKLTFCNGKLSLSHQSGNKLNNECLNKVPTNSKNLSKTTLLIKENEAYKLPNVPLSNHTICSDHIRTDCHSKHSTDLCVSQTNNAKKPKRNFRLNWGRGKKSNKKTTIKTKFMKIEQNQLVLDAGQRNLYDMDHCIECKFAYHTCDTWEVTAHEIHHNFQTVLHFTGWKREHIVAKFINSRILQVTPNDPKPWLKRIKQLLGLINRDMGYFDMIPDFHFTRLYLFVTNHKIVGCLVAEPITQGRKLLENESEIDICSDEIYEVKCGISRIWVLEEYRKQGIASLLVDSLKENFLCDYILSNEDIALCSPAESGKKFAQKYFKTSHFYIYGI